MRGYVRKPVVNLPAVPELMGGRLGLTPDNNYYCLPDLEGRRVLEIGCNEGYLARHILRNLKPLDYCGIDPWIGSNQTPELRPRFRQGHIQRRETLPMNERWDVVICFDVLYHLLSPLEAILNLYELTGECLVIGTTIIPEGESNSPNYPIEPHIVKGPVFRFEPGYNGDESNFLYPTEQCLIRMLEWASFEKLEPKYYYKDSASGYFHDRACYHSWKTAAPV
jgi:SAM-dependent methyltransferase